MRRRPARRCGADEADRGSTNAARCRRADRGEGRARRLARHGTGWRAAWPSVINVLDPDIIVLGGGLSNIDAIYSGLPDLILKSAFTDVLHTKIVRAVHGDSSGVRGAAWLWPQGAAAE